MTDRSCFLAMSSRPDAVFTSYSRVGHCRFDHGLAFLDPVAAVRQVRTRWMDSLLLTHPHRHQGNLSDKVTTADLNHRVEDGLWIATRKKVL